jgi:hypothetical protein
VVQPGRDRHRRYRRASYITRHEPKYRSLLLYADNQARRMRQSGSSGVVGKGRRLHSEARAKSGASHRVASGAAGNTSHMVDDTARDRAIYHALKAADEVAAALQAHLIEEHGADPDRTAAHNRSTNSLKLLRQARERLGHGLRAVEANTIAEFDKISLRNP